MKCALTKLLTLSAILSVVSGPTALAQEPDSGPPPPVRIVVQFLQLSDSQAAGLLELRQEAAATLDELHREILIREQRLEEILKVEEPSPVEVGALVVQISRLEQRANDVHASFVESFAATLEPEQQGRLQVVVQARQVQNILPAFAALGLIP